MIQLWVVQIFSYLISSVLIVKDQSFRYIFGFLKGYLMLFFVGLYLHSGLSYLLAAVGIMAGHLRPIFHQFKGETVEWVALGIIFYMSPLMAFLVLACFFIMMEVIIKDYQDSVFVTALFIPVFAFKIFTSDSFVIISVIIFSSLVVEFWPSFFKTKIRPKALMGTAAGLMGLFVLILMFFNKYVYKGFGMQKDIIRHGTAHFKYVAITFDDGPDPIYTPEILDILEEKNVKATFFLVGKNVETYPEIARRIAREGHSIGNHTYSHRSLIPLSAKGTVSEIKKAEKVIEDVVGIRPTLFRPPRGVYSSFAREFLKQERYTIVLWGISAVDWAELAPHKIVANVVKKVSSGSIILLHDSGDLITYKGGNRSSTVKALPKIIDELRDNGCEFVTIDQLIIFTELMETEDAEYVYNNSSPIGTYKGNN